MASRNGTGSEAAWKAKIAKQERIIGKQAAKIEILKKFPSKPTKILTFELLEAGYHIQAICEVVGAGR